MPGAVPATRPARLPGRGPPQAHARSARRARGVDGDGVRTGARVHFGVIRMGLCLRDRLRRVSLRGLIAAPPGRGAASRRG